MKYPELSAEDQAKLEELDAMKEQADHGTPFDPVAHRAQLQRIWPGVPILPTPVSEQQRADQLELARCMRHGVIPPHELVVAAGMPLSMSHERTGALQ